MELVESISTNVNSFVDDVFCFRQYDVHRSSIVASLSRSILIILHVMISYFTYHLTDFLSKFYPPRRLDLAQYGSLRHRYNKSGLRADKPVSFFIMICWNDFEFYQALNMNGIFVLPSSTRIQFQKISTYQVWFCIKIWANIVAGNRCIQLCLSCQVFFCNADFTLYACVFLAGCHLKCFGDGRISEASWWCSGVDTGIG